MGYTKKIINWGAVPLLLIGLTGCYYPVYQPYPYGYMPARQINPVANNGPECREYMQSATINGKPQQIANTACRQPDGTWQNIDSGAQVNMPPGSGSATASYPSPQAYYPAPVYYPPPFYYAEPFPYPYAEPVIVGGGFYVGGGGRFHHWR